MTSMNCNKKKISNRKNFSITNMEDLLALLNKYGNNIIDIEVPIIGVFNLGENLRSSLLACQIRDEFKKRGYSVSFITSKSNALVKAAHAIPIELFSSSIDDTTQVHLLNQMMYEICKKENSDILIVEISEGIIPISKDITNNYGLHAFKVSRAVKIDIGFLVLYADLSSKDFFDKFTNLFNFRFSIEDVFFGISNKKLDWSGIRASKQLKIMDVNKDATNKILNDATGYNAFNLIENSELLKTIDCIEAGLINNAVVDAY